jgi:hypothetical protein
MVEILTLWSPHKLLKYLGILSEFAKCIQSSTKKIEILTPPLYPGYNGMVKKTISRYCPCKDDVSSQAAIWILRRIILQYSIDNNYES